MKVWVTCLRQLTEQNWKTLIQHCLIKGEVDSINLDKLETSSKLIATHGLAVFLVIYYAIFLYPTFYKERESWITQIEELRRSINPDEKRMSASQAESILDYVTDLYVLNVKSELPINSYAFMLPGGGTIGGGFSYGASGFSSLVPKEKEKPKNHIEINTLMKTLM